MRIEVLEKGLPRRRLTGRTPSSTSVRRERNPLSRPRQLRETFTTTICMRTLKARARRPSAP